MRFPKWIAPVALAAVYSSPLTVPRPSNAQALERLFYYVDRQDSYESLVKNIDQITVLGPQVYTVDSLGIVFGELDSRVLALAKAHRVKVMPRPAVPAEQLLGNSVRHREREHPGPRPAHGVVPRDGERVASRRFHPQYRRRASH